MGKTRANGRRGEQKCSERKEKKHIRVKKKSKRFLLVETIQAYFYCGVKLSVYVFRNCR